MVKLSKLYTKQGDNGETGLIGGERVLKTHPQVRAYGEVDELNAWLGHVRASLRERSTFDIDSRLHSLQQDLFDIGAELATPRDSDWQPPSIVGKEEITLLEKDIDSWTSQVEELKSFLLPGGSTLTSAIHIARTVSRRVERTVIDLHCEEPVRSDILIYLNRLSDWLFALARVVAKENGEQEHLWETNRKK